jgi:hypothetical protein
MTAIKSGPAIITVPPLDSHPLAAILSEQTGPHIEIGQLVGKEVWMNEALLLLG